MVRKTKPVCNCCNGQTARTLKAVLSCDQTLIPNLWNWLAQAQWPYFPAAIAMGLLAAAITLISGSAILRLPGIAALIATFVFLAIVNTIYSNWEGVTGATSSVVGLGRYANEWVTLAWAVFAIFIATLYATHSKN